MSTLAQQRVVVEPRRALSREEAAAYVGIGATMFDELVREGSLPQPVWIRSRKVWDIRALDLAFDKLAGQDTVSANSWSDV